MAEKKLDKVFKDFSTEEVPDDKTHSWISMGLIWSGVGISLGLLLTAGTVADGLSVQQTAIAALLGGALLGLVAFMTGIIGAKTKLSTAMISRFTFGKKAIIIIALIQALGSYGWFAVQLGLFGRTASTSWEMATGVSGNESLFIIVGGLLMILTAIFGYKGIDLLSKIAVPVMLILIVGSLWIVLKDFSLTEILNFKGQGETISVGLGISLVFSSFVVGAVVAPDVSRYAKSTKDVVLGSLLAFTVVTPIILMVGVVMSQATGTWDIVEVMLRLGWGLIAFLVLILAQWSTNDNNLYSAVLGFAVVFQKLKRWHLSLFAGGLGIILALSGIYDNFQSFLVFLGILIPPMGGVIIVDYYFFNKDNYKLSNLDALANTRYIVFASWLVGSLVAVMTSYTDITITTVPALDSGFTAAIVFFLAMKIINKNDMLIKVDDSAPKQKVQ